MDRSGGNPQEGGLSDLCGRRSPGPFPLPRPGRRAELNGGEVPLKELASFPILSFTAECGSYAEQKEKALALENRAGITEVVSCDILRRLCLQGMGVGFLPGQVARRSAHVCRGRLHVVRVFDLHIVRDYACIHIGYTPLSKPALTLLENVRALAASCRRDGAPDEREMRT